MSEFRNYIVLAGCPVEKTAEAVCRELTTKRKWEAVSGDTAGAKFIDVWCSRSGFTVVQLVSEIESDPALGKALSRDCEGPVAVHFYESHSGVTENLAFDKGKKAAVGRSPFAEMFRSDSWDELEPEGSVTTLSFRDAKSERVSQVMDLLREFIEPVLHELSMKPTKVLGNYPSIGFAIGYGLDMEDGTRVVVRYTVPTDGALTIEQDIWREKGEGSEYQEIARGDRTSFVPDLDPALLPDLLRRECQLLAARLVRHGAAKIEEAAPLARPVIEAARRTESWRVADKAFDDLERRRNVAQDRGSEWAEAKVVFKGAQLMLVQAGGLPRFTFRFDTAGLAEGEPVAVGELWESWAGTVGARKLRVGATVLMFGYDGKYLGIGGA